MFAPTKTAEAAVTWYNLSYAYRKQITLDRTKIPHTDTNNVNSYLTDFPVLVSITDDNLKFAPTGKVQKSDGSDIIFANKEGTTLLNYEIELYDKDNGTLNAWVKIPYLNDTTNTQNTVIFMYYGNSAATANTEANIQGVWDSSFKMVQHMNQTGTGVAGDYKDSTVNDNDSTNTTLVSEPTAVAGKIGKAESFDGTQYMDMGKGESLNITGAITLGAWVKTSALSGDIVGKNLTTNNQRGYFIASANGKLRFNTSADGIIGKSLDSSILINTSDWVYVVGTFDGSFMRSYINGVLATTPLAQTAIFSNTSNISIANLVSNGRFNGLIDEVRISSSARSADWVEVEYANQSNPSVFLSIGPEGDRVTPPSLSEITPIEITNDTTPTYLFSSTKSGEITYGGDCSSSTAFADSGNNTITFNSLSLGTHSNCTIAVTDAAGNISSVLDVTEFTVKSDYTWYNNSYSYRKQITIDRTKISHTDTNNTNSYLTDFPVLVSLTDDNLKTITNSGKVQKDDGSDIIFANQEGTKLLNYEIESYDNATGTINAWVKIPHLNDITNTQNTVIFMYYGNAAATANNEANIQGVWDSNFKMVQHMNQEGGGSLGVYKDSTVNDNDSINTANQPMVVDGKIGKAESFDGSQYMDMGMGNGGSLNITGAITLGAWIKTSGLSGDIVGKNLTTNNQRGYFIASANGKLRFNTSANGIDTRNIDSSILINTSDWVYVVGTFDGSFMRSYINGVLVTTPLAQTSIFSNTVNVFIAKSVSSGWFSGALDEVRISNATRSADWINAEYLNESNPSTFYNLSSEQSVSIPSLDHFSTSGSSSQASGSSQTITIIAIDYEGNTFTSYTGDKEITFSGANTTGNNTPTASDKNEDNIPFNTPAALTFTNGVAHADITLYKAETIGIGIKDIDNYSSSGYNLNITVSPRDNIESIGINAPLFVVSNNPFSLTLSTQDAYANPVNNPISPVILSTDKGSISPSSVPSSSFTNGTYAGDFTVNNITENTDITITARYNSIISATTIPVRGIDQMDHFAIVKADIQTTSATIIIGKTNEPNTSNFFYTGNYPDDAACIQAALDSAKSGDTILIRSGDYQIARQISQTGKDLNIIGEGDVKMHVNFESGDNAAFLLRGTQIIRTSFIANAAQSADTIQLQDTSNILAGDLIRIYNDTRWEPNYYPNLKTGETYIIKSISENTITLEESLLHDYPLALNSGALVYRPIKVNIKNLSFYGMSTEGSGVGLQLQFCKDSNVSGCYFNSNGNRSLAVYTCANVDIGNNIMLNSNMTGLGYGVNVADGGFNVRIHDNLMRNCRHTIAVSGSPVYGENRDVYVYNNTLYQDNGKGSVVDAHQMTINYFVTGNTIYTNNQSAFGDGAAYSIFANNFIYGGNSGQGIAKRGATNNTTHIITKNTVLNSPLTLSSFPNTKELYVKDNYVSGKPDGYAIYFPSSGTQNFTVQNNKVIGAKYPFFISIPDSSVSNVTISNNQISNPQQSAIYINYASSSFGTLNLYNNIIHNPGSYGVGYNAIELYGVKNSLIAANDITDDNHHTLYGIYEDANSSNNNIFQNTSSGLLGQTLFSQSTNTNLTPTTIPIDTPTLYPLTVTNGSGSGSYEVGEEVNISANIPSNKVFDRWTGDIGYISDIYSSDAIATLPQEPITLTPTYKDIDTINIGDTITIDIRAISTGKDSYILYTGDKTVTINGATGTCTDKNNNDIALGYPTTLTFINGMASCDLKLKTTGISNLTVNDGTYASASFPVMIPSDSTASTAFLPPSKPPISTINITTSDNTLSLTNLPTTITQIAISNNPDFTNSSWEDISKKDDLLKQYTNTDTLYIKFRTQEGGVSDTVTYTKDTNTTQTNTTPTLQDGDLIKTPNNPDVYVIKYKNNKQYKRLLLSPTIFNSYLHLKWNNIKTISQQQSDQYQTSNLVKETTDTIIYQLFPDNDTGKRKPLNPSTSYDPDSIYEINKPERDSYELED